MIYSLAGMEIKMIDFEEELNKFQPVLEVDDAEDAIYHIDTPDIVELISSIAAEASNK